MYCCKYCNKITSNKGGLSTHEPYCSNNPYKKVRPRSPKAGAKKGNIPWNKGKVGLYSDEYRMKLSNSLKGKNKGISSTEEKELERRIKISKSMRNNPLSGGLRKGSGRGIKGKYMGIYCDSTWELAWIIYHNENNIKFKRNYEGFEYTFNGKVHKYYPDFILEDTFIEIKGRRSYESLTIKERTKIDLFKEKLIVLFESDMKPILNYVISKYGKKYYYLYD